MAATDGPGPGMDLSRKLGPLPIWAWAAIGVGIALFMSKKKAGASSSSATGYSPTAQQQAAALSAGGLSSLYPLGYSDYSSSADLAQVLQQLNNEVTALGGGNGGTNKSPAPAPGKSGHGTSQPSVFNPYTLGTVVAPGEKIVEVVPVGTRGYIDVTSLGGLYGVGLNVSGSAYDPKAKGSYSVRVSGNKVYESTPTGVKVYSYK